MNVQNTTHTTPTFFLNLFKNRAKLKNIIKPLDKRVTEAVVTTNITPNSFMPKNTHSNKNYIYKASNPTTKKNLKLFPEDNQTNFDYTKPKVDLEGMALSDLEKNQIEKNALKKFKHAMKVLDYSIADASKQLLIEKNNPELWETLNKFTSRYLDMYEAYIEVQKENKEILLPRDIAIAKSYGYTHQEIKSLVDPAKWYQGNKDQLINDIRNSGLKLSNQDDITETYLQYLSDKNYRIGSLRELDKFQNKETCGSFGITYGELKKHLKDKKVFAALKQFCLKMRQNKILGTKIKSIDKKMSTFRAERSEIESFKQKLSALDLSSTMENKDSKLAVLHEIDSRFNNSEKEPGFVGSSLRLLNIVKGKHDLSEHAGAIFRHKLFFIYKSKSIANEIISSPQILKDVNEKLLKKGWQIDTATVDYLTRYASEAPIYKLGTYAKENWTSKIREHLPTDQVIESKKKSPNLTFYKANQLGEAKQRDNCNAKELTTPFRLNISEAEEIAYLGSTSKIEKREMKNRSHFFKKNKRKKSNKKIDTSFFESPLDYKKKTTLLPWISGKHFFKLGVPVTDKPPYLQVVDDLGLPQQAGISGSTDQTLTMANVIGIDSPEEIKQLRLIYLAWMTAHDDHSVDEILTSAKSFGIDYTPSPDYYKEIYPEAPSLVEKIEVEQQKRGLKMPDYYLSKQHAQKELSKIKNEQEKKQNAKLIDCLSNHRVFLKSIIGSNNLPASNIDLFQTRRSEPFLRKLNTPKKPTSLKGKVKFVYNPKKKQLEKQKKAKSSFYKGTKKTSVTLLPSYGKILPYEYKKNDSVGLLFDRKKSEFKDQYSFKADALTDNKWWKRLFTNEEIQAPDFKNKLSQEVKKIESKNGKGKEQSFNHLRMPLKKLIKKIESTTTFNEHNEILASVKNEGILGVFGVNKKIKQKGQKTPTHSPDYDLYIKFKAIANKLSLKTGNNIEVPVYIIDEANDKGLTLYPRNEQIKDLKTVLKNKNGEFKRLVNLIQQKTSLPREVIAKSLKKHLRETLKQI